MFLFSGSIFPSSLNFLLNYKYYSVALCSTWQCALWLPINQWEVTILVLSLTVDSDRTSTRISDTFWQLCGNGGHSWSIVCCGIVLGSDVRIFHAVCLNLVIFIFCKLLQWTWYKISVGDVQVVRITEGISQPKECEPA